jgi:HEAT repeat protein
MRYLTRADLDRISDSVVMIQQGSSLGTGFFVLPGVVASCQHVVEIAVAEQPKLLWRDRTLPLARIVASPRPSTLDLVLFEIGETEHPLLPIAAADAGTGDVFSFGFQYAERGYSGYSLWGTLAGYAVDTSAGPPQRLLLVTGANVQPGASGAPLFSLEDGKVVGVVKRSNPDGGGYAVRIEELEDLRPGILDRSRELAPARELAHHSLTRYVRQLGREHSHITMVDLRRELKLEDVYVSLTLAPQSVTGARMALGVTGTLSLSGDMGSIEKVEARRDLGSPQRRYRQAEVPLGELLSQSAAIILGEPGAGKTTLLRHLLLRTCRGELFTGRVPVLIKVANIKKREPGCLVKFIERVYAPYASAILEATMEGKAVYFIDGFDEIPKRDHEILQNEVNRLAADQNTVFVTCRSAAFPKGLFSSAFRVFECFGFNASQQRRFLRQWFAGQRQLAIRMERQLRTSSGVTGFARNPLLLSFLAIVVENDPEFRLPTQRAELYKRVIDVFLERRANLTEVLSLPRHVKLRFLERLAFDLMSSASEIVDEADLLDRIESWQATSTNRRLQQLSSDEVLDHLVEQDGVLAEAAPQSYRFIHLTFQEYLAATYLADLEDWAKVVVSWSGDPRWEEVLRLLAGSLEAAEADRLVGLLWSKTSREGRGTPLERRFLAARCASDVREISPEMLETLAGELVQYVFDEKLEPVVTEAAATLAALCGAHSAVLDSVREFLERESVGGLSFAVLFRYVDLLSLTASSGSTAGLLQLLDQTIERAGQDEAITLLAGEVIAGLGNSGDPTLVPHLAPLLDNESSYIAAHAASALLELADESAGAALQDLWRSLRDDVRVLAASVLFRSLDAKNLRGMLRTAFCEEPDAIAQLTARQIMNPDACDPDVELVSGLLQCCSGEGDRARLLGMTGLVAYLDDTAFLEQMVFDVGLPSVLRCAALEAFLRLQPSQAEEVLARLLDADESVLVRVCVAVLGRTGNNQGHGVLIQRVGRFSHEWLVHVTIDLFTQVRSLPTQSWLLDVVRAAPPRSETQMRALMALAAQRREAIIPTLREYLDLPPDRHLSERVIAYQALAQIGTQSAYDLTVGYLFAENDIVVITRAIEALGDMGVRQAEQPLLRCLAPGRWPSSWPPPEPALEPGEQRPSDRRRLAAIIGLNKLSSVSALAALREVADDPEEAIETRQAAYIAGRTIAWNAGAPPPVAPAQPLEGRPQRRRWRFPWQSG